MRAVVYCRQSLDRTGEGLAVARQRDDCLRLAGERHWTVIDTVIDNDVSASTSKPRPGFMRVLEMIDSRSVDVVIAWHVDRLVRKLADLEDVIERCEKAGVRVATVSGDIDLSTDAGRLVGRILASVARGEVERKGARQRAARVQAAQSGAPVKWSPRSFGYDDDKLTPRPDEAEAVRDAATQLLSGGTLRSVAKQWNAKGLTPPQRGKRWTYTTVRSVLRNPRIAGISTHNGEEVGRGQWAPLIDEETFRALGALFSDPSRRPPKGTTTLLGAIATCACGAPVYGGQSSRRGRIYRCRDLPGGGGGHVARSAPPIDEFVSSLVVARMGLPDAAELLVDQDRPDAEKLREQAAGIRARLDQVAEEFADDDTVTPAQFRAMTKKLRDRLADVEAQQADAARLSVLGPLVGVADVQAAWVGLDIDRQRAVVSELLSIQLLKPGMGARTFDPSTVIITPKL